MPFSLPNILWSSSGAAWTQSTEPRRYTFPWTHDCRHSTSLHTLPLLSTRQALCSWTKTHPLWVSKHRWDKYAPMMISTFYYPFYALTLINQMSELVVVMRWLIPCVSLIHCTVWGRFRGTTFAWWRIDCCLCMRLIIHVIKCFLSLFIIMLKVGFGLRVLGTLFFLLTTYK